MKGRRPGRLHIRKSAGIGRFSRDPDRRSVSTPLAIELRCSSSRCCCAFCLSISLPTMLPRRHRHRAQCRAGVASVADQPVPRYRLLPASGLELVGASRRTRASRCTTPRTVLESVGHWISSIYGQSVFVSYSGSTHMGPCSIRLMRGTTQYMTDHMHEFITGHSPPSYSEPLPSHSPFSPRGR